MWMVMYSYLSGSPDSFPVVGLEAEVQAFADAKKVRRDRPPIGPLTFNAMTDQVDVYFMRNGRQLRFMTLMAA